MPLATMKRWIFSIPDWMRTRFTDAQRFMILCILAGLFCGLAAVGFHLSIHHTFHLVWELAEFLDHHGLLYLITVVPALGGLGCGYILTNYAPSAAGSGIPQTKSAYYNNFGVIGIRDGVWRFVLGTLFIGSGNALGREGPTVHMCSAIASRLAQSFGLAKARIQGMVPVGMAAGIAAAFNAPLSAILFVFEELLDDFSTKALSGIVVAVVIAAAVSRMLLGEEPVLHVELGVIATAPWMLVALPMGVTAALIGCFFVRLLLESRKLLRVQKRIPAWLRPGIAGLLVGLLATWAFTATGENGVFSIGYESLERAFDFELAGSVLLTLFLCKFLAVLIGYASGGSGGLFSPTLFLGGMLGGLFGLGLLYINSELLSIFRGAEDGQVVGACVLLGMGAMFASIVRCPFTSLVIIFEMTRDYSLILPLMIGNMISYYIANRLQRVSLYNALLLQDGINLRKMPAYQGARDYQNLPVSTIMTYEVVSVAAQKNAAENLALLKKLGKSHHGYPALNADGRIAGMIMHHELEEHVEHGIDAPLWGLLAKQRIISVTPETSIRQAASVMIREDVLQVPVVAKSDDRKLLGFLTLHDIARQQNAISEQLGR